MLYRLKCFILLFYYGKISHHDTNYRPGLVFLCVPLLMMYLLLCSFQDHLGFPNVSILIRDFGCSESITSPADCCDIQRYLWS